MKHVAPDLQRFVTAMAYVQRDAKVHRQLKELKSIARAAMSLCDFDDIPHPGMKIEIKKVGRLLSALRKAGLK
jgi:hypothetical protein